MDIQFLCNKDISQIAIKGSWGKSLADHVGHWVAYWQAMQFEGYFVDWIGFPFEDLVIYVWCIWWLYVVCSLKLCSDVRPLWLCIPNIDISKLARKGSKGKSLADDVGHVVAYWQAMQFEVYFVVWIRFPFKDSVIYV